MAKSTPTKAKAKAKAKPAAASAAAPRPKVTVRTVSAKRNRFDYKGFISRRVASRDVKLGALLAEAAAAFVVTAVVLNTSGNVIIAAVAILVLTTAFWRLSGGHANPAVTVALWAGRYISGLRATGYIVAQILGAMLAVVVVTQFTATSTQIDPSTGMTPHVFSIEKITGDWRPFLAEALGGLVLGLGVAAARLGRRESLEAGWLVGGALLLGLILASQGSSALLNPAVALGVSAYHLDNWWSVWTYALAPAFGASVGVWLYKAMQWEMNARDTE
ncbi:MAG TPA: aquaporin [Candidatus Saccharimonadales bacterium]|nr:aquaporin [Candidatus Saccharimonadales bacterium]